MSRFRIFWNWYSILQSNNYPVPAAFVAAVWNARQGIRPDDEQRR
jgi:hypothetical protein